MSAKNLTYKSSTVIRFLSVFLLFVFVQANFIKLFHHHNSETETTSHFNFKKDSGTDHCKTLAEKCDFCDFIKHQSQDFLSETVQHLSFSKLKTFSSKSYFVLGESRAYLLSCTNKGPPAVYSLT